VRLLLPLVACVLAAGCTAAVETPPAPTQTPPPPRPREVRLDGVDPCTLLSPEQRAALGLDGTPRLSDPYAELFGGAVPTCTITGLTGEPIAVGVGTVTSVGIERWRRGDLAAEVHPTMVADFPAVVAVPQRLTDYCSVEVDVAAGQLLDVQFSDGGGKPPIPQDELCRRAGQVADELMTSLLAR
jgi:Protein of unknown function (DUF3558)